MSTMLEHDYIGLSEPSPKERTSEKLPPSSSSSSSSSNVPTEDGKNRALPLKETELRLGLPGSESPERKLGHGMSLFWGEFENGGPISPLKSPVSGAKRSSDAIDGSGKWVFCGNGGSEANLGKIGAGLLSLRGGINGDLGNKNSQLSVKEVVGVVVPPPSPKPVEEKKSPNVHGSAPAAKAQVVGWPPIRSFRKNTMVTNSTKNNENGEGKSGKVGGCLYVKVSMDGAPYLRKVDLKIYSNYIQLSSALEKMFSCFTIGTPGEDGRLTESHLMDLLHGSEYVLTYEDKDGDWMLVGDVPWEMFTDSCKRLRIMKGSEAIGLAPRAMEKCKNRN